MIYLFIENKTNHQQKELKSSSLLKILGNIAAILNILYFISLLAAKVEYGRRQVLLLLTSTAIVKIAMIIIK